MAWNFAIQQLRLLSPSRPRTRTFRLQGEQLESRVVLDARVLITEIVASNDQGLEDEDGDTSDWIEIFNAGDTAADLSGWYLTDRSTEKMKWKFPATTLGPEEYLLVYASGKDRAEPNQNLHTNFQLSSDGEYLGLVSADGETVAFEFAPNYPAQRADTSFGLPQSADDKLLIGTDSPVRALVPSVLNEGDTLGTNWTSTDFDDGSWIAGTGGVGFERSTGYEEFIGADVSEMFSVNSTAFVRYPFVLDSAAISNLTLRLRYDDGFIAYLNGVEVSRMNAPDDASWDAKASATNRDAMAKEFEDFDVSDSKGLLRLGENVLAIHGLNSSVSSDDFLIQLELVASIPAAIESEAPGFVERPTPATPNGLTTFRALVANVEISQTRGLFDQSIQVAVSTSTPGATLAYTTDGSVPSFENGTLINSPDPTTPPSALLDINKTTNLRVAAVMNDALSAKTETHSYIIVNDIASQDYQSTLDAGFPAMWVRAAADYGVDPKVVGPNDEFEGEFANQFIDSLKAAPTVSIVMNRDDLFGDDGIYVNSTRSGFDWERETSFELIYPDGRGIQADAGIRIQGDNVRNLDNSKKQSMRVEFRSQYGPTKLRFPVFGEDATDSFDTLILRGGYNDGWVHTPNSTQFIRDDWARTTLLEMGQPNAHSQFMHVYLNGFYWGLYNTIERPNASFSASYFGGDKDDWDALNTGQVRDGDKNAWDSLNQLARAVRADTEAESDAAALLLLGRNPDGTENPDLETMIDLDNYFDYLIVNMYGGNVDWPHRNYYAGRQRGAASTGFKFYAWDTEKILDHGEGSNLNTNQTGVNQGAALPFRFMMENAELRLAFADRIHQHFFNGGALYVNPDSPAWDPANPTNNRPAERYSRLADAVELPLIGESARWGDTQSNATRNDGRVYTLREWRAIRDRLFEQYFPRRSEIVLAQFQRADFYPSIAAPTFSQHGGAIGAELELQITGPGTVYYTLDGTDPRQSSLEPGVSVSGVSPNALPYSGPVGLTTSVVVKSRALVDGEWSAVNVATFTSATPSIRVSEFMYHPSEFGDRDSEDFEFIELVNISTTESIDLSGIRFTDGVELELGEGSLSPGEYGVVARNSEAFQQRYGNEVRILGQYGGTESDFQLSNQGETIRLEDGFGSVIQEFSYDDTWFPSTDGQGESLNAIDPTANVNWSDAASWRKSLYQGGTPGTEEIGDYDGNREIEPNDVNLFCTGLRANDQAFDLTSEGRVDTADLIHLIESIYGTSIGDTNLDGKFGTDDLVRIFAAGEYEDDIGNNSTWQDGDFNCDGDFSSRDLILAFERNGFTAESIPITSMAIETVFTETVFTETVFTESGTTRNQTLNLVNQRRAKPRLSLIGAAIEDSRWPSSTRLIV